MIRTCQAAAELLTAALLLTATVALAHESPVDHVERQVQLTLGEGRLDVRYRVEPSQRNVLLQMRRMDTNRDGAVDAAERQEYLRGLAAELARRLNIEIDGKPLELALEGEVELDPRFGQTFRFSAPCDLTQVGRHACRLTDAQARYAPGPYRLLQPPITAANKPQLVLTERPQLVDLQQHPGLVVVDFEIVVPAPAGR